MQEEVDKIKKAYFNRKKIEASGKLNHAMYSSYIAAEREKIYETIIQKSFSNLKNRRLIEIGAGGGSNIEFFHQLGISYSNIFANELIDERINDLKKKFPEINVLEGNAMDIKIDSKFDIVFQSTVFTSILNDDMQLAVAKKMWEVLSDDGIILWYDFVYNNPNNKDVRKVSRKRIKALFPNGTMFTFIKVTLAPPIGRRVGKMYPFFNTFKFLRTHLIAVIRK
ncbi:MAG: class I SAM-dependent methyltransferase [Bacteroidota bacterium]